MQGGGDHAASRYITSKLSNITRFIFRPEDDAILEYLNDEGKYIEPKTFAPIIPLILINGTKGIGTGFSTYIPTFNPKEVINNVRNLINGNDVTDIVPWFRNFKGDVKSFVVKGVKKYMSYGRVEKVVGEKGMMRITELPIEVWTESYLASLDKMTSKDSRKHLLADHGINIGGNHDIDITIEFNSDQWLEIIKKNDDEDLMKKLKLMKSIAITNMHMYNADGKITKYDFVEDIFYDFYNYRYKMYEKRRNYMIRLLTNEMLLAKYKALFIEKCINEEIIIAKKRDKTLVHEQLEKLKFPKLSHNIDAKEEDKTYDYTEMNIYSQTEEKVEELRKIYEEKKKKLEDYKKTTIEQLWTRELDELEEKYDKWLAEQNDDLDEERKIEDRQKKNGNKRGKKGKKN
jgi:DNA topoisomerase-2